MDDFYNQSSIPPKNEIPEINPRNNTVKNFFIVLVVLLGLGSLGYLAFWYYNQTTQKLTQNDLRLEQLEDQSKITDLKQGEFADDVYLQGQTEKGDISSAKIKDAIITVGDLDDEIFTLIYPDGTEAKVSIGAGSIDTYHLADGSVTTLKIAQKAVTSVELADGSVTNIKILDGAVTSGKIADGTIITQDLADGSVTTNKIADGAITNSKLADSSITNEKIADYTITGQKIANDGSVMKSLDGADGITATNNMDSSWTVEVDYNTTNLKITSGQLNTIQDIAPTSSPTFAGLTLTNLTQGSVVFAGVGGVISQDNSNLFWDNASSELGIGTNSPDEELDVIGSIALNDYLYFENNTNNYVGYDGSDFTVTDDWLPSTDSTYNLGSSTPLYWANSYIDRMYVNATAYIDGAVAGTHTVQGHIVPSADDTYDLGSDTSRWANLYLGGETIHLGSTGDESQISYVTASDLLTFQNSADATAGFQFLDADGGTPILNIDTTNERVGVGTNAPTANLEVIGSTIRLDNSTGQANYVVSNTSGSSNSAGYFIQNDTDYKWGWFNDPGNSDNLFLKKYNTAQSDPLILTVSGSDSSNRIYSYQDFSIKTEPQSDYALTVGGNIYATGRQIINGVAAINRTAVDYAVGLRVDSPTTGSTDYAIYGSGSEIGVAGMADSRGVYGGSISGFGVMGSSQTGSGVHGYCNGADCRAVYGLTEGSGSTYAGYFSGNVYISGNGYLAGSAQGNWDLAEMTPYSGSQPDFGDVVAFVPGSSESVKTASKSDQNVLAGIVSTEPSTVMGVRAEDENWQTAMNNRNEIPLALAGRVPVKVTNENGSIVAGDKLTISSTSGYAMKATDAGMVIGIAMQDFNSNSGRIIAYVNVFYYNPNTEEGLQGSSTLTADTINSTENQDIVISPDSGKTKIVGNLVVSDNIVADSLTVTKSIATTALLVMEKTTTTDLQIKGHLIGSSDTRGVVSVPAGQEQIEYEFNEKYQEEPVLVATPTEDPKTTYWVETFIDKFILHLADPAYKDLEFNWTAVQ